MNRKLSRKIKNFELAANSVATSSGRDRGHQQHVLSNASNVLRLHANDDPHIRGIIERLVADVDFLLRPTHADAKDLMAQIAAAFATARAEITELTSKEKSA